MPSKRVLWLCTYNMCTFLKRSLRGLHSEIPRILSLPFGGLFQIELLSKVPAVGIVLINNAYIEEQSQLCYHYFSSLYNSTHCNSCFHCMIIYSAVVTFMLMSWSCISKMLVIDLAYDSSFIYTNLIFTEYAVERYWYIPRLWTSRYFFILFFDKYLI